MRASCVAAVGLLAGVVAAQVPAQPVSEAGLREAAQQIRQCADRLAAKDLFSGVVLIQHNGQPVLEYARAASGTGPLTMDTPFNVASVPKMFTAVATGQLVEQGRLRFSDPVGAHLPELPPALARVRLDQLLTHQGGIRGMTELTPEIATAIRAAATARDLVPLIAKAGLAFEPGSRTQYSNGGFVLLGAVVEAVSGTSFRDYLAANVFGPAGMTKTSLKQPADAAVRMTRMSPNAPPGGRARTNIGAGGTPAGGHFSSARDLARFASALRDKRLVGASTLDALLTNRSNVGAERTGRGERRGYGYGFMVVDTASDKVVGHNGGAPGSNAEVAISMRNGWTVVALSNIDPPAATNLLTFALQALSGGDGSLAECDRIGATPGPMDGPPPNAPAGGRGERGL